MIANDLQHQLKNSHNWNSFTIQCKNANRLRKKDSSKLRIDPGCGRKGLKDFTSWKLNLTEKSDKWLSSMITKS